MNLKNWLTLTIRTLDLNLVAKHPDLVSKMRELTLGPHSGLNYELNRMLKDCQTREVNCKILLAYRFKELIGWALLSKEDTDFFINSQGGFHGADGWMFQLYVNPSHRRAKIGSELYRTALKTVGNEVLHVSPWSDASYKFYAALPNANRIEL
jgi:ribosomal protein S18 acetylase RimI-like enzyme